MSDIDTVRDALAGVLPREQDPFAALDRIRAENERLKVWLASERELRRRIEAAARELVRLANEARDIEGRTTYDLPDEVVEPLRTALEEER